MILLPILYILCGSAWFLNPQVKASAIPIAIAAILGLVMSVPLIVTTNYEIRGDGNIYARKSRAFIVSLVVLVVIRFALRNVVQQYNLSTMIMLLYVVAATYIVPWRIASFSKFRKILNAKNANSASMSV